MNKLLFGRNEMEMDNSFRFSLRPNRCFGRARKVTYSNVSELAGFHLVISIYRQNELHTYRGIYNVCIDIHFMSVFLNRKIY